MGHGSMLEGVLEGIERGWFQQEIAESAFLEQRRYETGDLIRVGVDAFVDPNDPGVDTLVIGHEAEQLQRDRISRTRTERDEGRAATTLAALAGMAATDVNLMEPLIDCAKARCTEGEIVGALTEVFGDYRETPWF
jgi:methylmalonyl-CoA mutase N-terminal domain/subunit